MVGDELDEIKRGCWTEKEESVARKRATSHLELFSRQAKIPLGSLIRKREREIESWAHTFELLSVALGELREAYGYCLFDN